MLSLLTWAGFGLVALGVTCYWAYTLLGLSSVAPYLLGVRRVSTVLGCLLAGANLQVMTGLLPFGLACILAGYAYQRQWLFPKPARQLGPSTLRLPPEAEVIEIPNCGLVPLSWAARSRTLWLPTTDGPLLISYCALARSLRVFGGASGDMAASLPHATGFYLQSGSSTWDGNSGMTTDSSRPALAPRSFVLTRMENATESLTTFTPQGVAYLPKPLHRTPRVPGARGIAGALDWGSVQNGQWVPAASARIHTQWALSRWAATAQGLVVL